MKKKVMGGLCIVNVVMVLMSFSGCLFVTTSKERKKLYEYYSDDGNYVSVQGVLDYCLSYDDHITIVINFNEECIEKLGNTVERFGGPDQQGKIGSDFRIVSKNHTILQEKGFYDLFEKIDLKTGECVFPYTIEGIVEPRIWYVGWGPVIVSIKVGDTVYLDYETGKANYLDWIQNDLR